MCFISVLNDVPGTESALDVCWRGIYLVRLPSTGYGPHSSGLVSTNRVRKEGPAGQLTPAGTRFLEGGRPPFTWSPDMVAERAWPGAFSQAGRPGHVISGVRHLHTSQFWNFRGCCSVSSTPHTIAL